MKLYKIKIETLTVSEFGTDDWVIDNVVEFCAAKRYFYVRTLDKVFSIERDLIKSAYFRHPNSRDFKEIHMKQF